VHHETVPSLDIRELDSGDVLIYCHGCKAGAKEVLAAIELPPGAAFIDWQDRTLTEHERRIAELERKARQHERELERQRRKDAELEDRLRKVEMLQRTRPDLKYHGLLNEERLAWWRSEGILPHTVERFRLGYCPSCPTAPGEESYTLPVYDIEGDLVNVRHRLLRDGDKYRPEASGLGSQLWNAPALAQAGPGILVVEGEKKGAVLSQEGFGPVVGLMGKSFRWRKAWFEHFRKFGAVTVCLDPDAIESAWRLGAMFAKEGFRDVRIANPPGKIDDYLLAGGDAKAVFDNARKCWADGDRLYWTSRTNLWPELRA